MKDASVCWLNAKATTKVWLLFAKLAFNVSVSVCFCMYACASAQWAPGVSKTQPGATQINRIHQTRVKIISETHKLRNIKQQGRAILSHIDAGKLILSSRGQRWGASTIHWIGKTRPFRLWSNKVAHLKPIWNKKGNIREGLKCESVAELDRQPVSPSVRG